MTESQSTAAPSMIDLESHLLLNEGLTIQTRAGLGRVAVATKPLTQLYQVVLRERPLLVWKVGDMESFLEKFKAAPSATQAIILDMYHPPLDIHDTTTTTSSPSILKFQGMAVELAKATNNDNVNWVHKLLMICSHNAHKFGSSGNSNNQDRHSALFAYASKMAHSCTPNLAYNSVKEGALEYKLIRPLKEGDTATFSYIGGGKKLYQTPTHQRRHKLWQTKSFFCQCPRCSGPDYCRFVNCTECQRTSCQCFYEEQDESNNNICKPIWTCHHCGVVETDDMLAQEKEIEDALSSIISLQAPDVEALQLLVEEASCTLSPTHYTTLQALETLMEWSSIKSKEDASKYSLIAAKAGLQLAQAGECVAAGCTGCTTTILDHDPIYEMGVTVFEASKNLMRVPQAERPPNGLATIQRYLPILAQMATNLN